jgi:hypothetical protein
MYKFQRNKEYLIPPQTNFLDRRYITGATEDHQGNLGIQEMFGVL